MKNVLLLFSFLIFETCYSQVNDTISYKLDVMNNVIEEQSEHIKLMNNSFENARITQSAGVCILALSAFLFLVSDDIEQKKYSTVGMIVGNTICLVNITITFKIPKWKF